MKKAFLIMAAIIAVSISGCKKTGDEATLSSSGMDLKKSEQPIPFNGTITGIITSVPSDCPGWTGRSFVGDGNVTHMGKTHAVLDYCMKTVFPSPAPGYDAIFKGPGVLTAANGDELNGFFIGTVEFTFEGNVPVNGHIEVDAVMFEGTGKFEGAHGFLHGSGEMDISAGAEIPMTVSFTGTIHYGSEFFEVTSTGLQNYTGSCGTGRNAYLYSGDLISTTVPSPGSCSMDYCATTAFAPPPYPSTLAIGGTNQGTGSIIDAEGDELNSEFAGLYRFTYLPTLQAPTSILNDAIGIGTMTGGTGVYEGATGTYLFYGDQTINLGPSGAQFPAVSNFYVVGWVNKENY